VSSAVAAAVRTAPRYSKAHRFQELLAMPGRFVVVGELVTSRGLITWKSGRRVMDLARALAQHPRFDALSLTDNPAGHAMLSADTLGTDLLSRGQEVIIHLSCKDANRNGLESRAFQLASEGFDNVLALSGDYPASGHGGQAAPVFDTDSVGLLHLLSHAGEGRLFLGAVINSHKRHESELMPQYFKLAKKLEHGARFIINQIGYDARKEDELLRYMHLKEWRVPVLANVYVLGIKATRYFHRGAVPGIVVTDELMALAERHHASPDGGQSFFLELAAKQCAIAKGLGFSGVYIGGRLKLEEYERLLEIWDSFGPDDWKLFVRDVHFGQPDQFHYFEPDSATGLNSSQVNRAYLESKSSPPAAPWTYRANRRVHQLIFEQGTSASRTGRALYDAIDDSPRIKKLLHVAEQAVKTLAFDCRDCGDCSLPDIAYLCPESQCAKNQRNGPCGGTRQGLCEVGEKECIWSRAYERLKAYGEEEHMLDRPVVFRDGALRGTSAWGNTFLARDHHTRDKGEEK
jgi:methylenetetrahydrofolate reductase (NADPH)